MRFQCPFCSYIIQLEDNNTGCKVMCPSCNQHIRAPKDKFSETCVIGDFLLDTKLGAGALATVYKATQLSLNRTVALKILFPEFTDPQGLSEFLHEARAASDLSHPNILRSLAIGNDGDVYYMAMTYIEGVTISDRIEKKGKVPVDEALHIIQQITEALYYAWDEAQLIHRDIKSENIMITPKGTAMLTDLGLALAQSEWNPDLEISGSPAYMAPEQFSGEKIDRRTDMYSLGITLYQMLTGEIPFEAETAEEVARQHFYQDPKPITKALPKVYKLVEVIVMKLLAKHPEDRYQSHEELLEDIWKARQKTAPNKELVPDIHTISVKRLDYNIQEESLRAKKTKRKRNKFTVNSDTGGKYKTFSILLLIIVMILLGTLFLGGKTPLYKDLDLKIKGLNAEFEKAKDYEFIKVKIDQFLQRIPAENSIENTSLRNALFLLSEKVQAKENKIAYSNKYKIYKNILVDQKIKNLELLIKYKDYNKAKLLIKRLIKDSPTINQQKKLKVLKKLIK